MHGEIELVLWYGRDQSGHWHCPVLVEADIGPHRFFTPGARRRVCAAAALTGTYEEAAQICVEWGLEADDSTIHKLVREVGAQAELQAHHRLQLPVPVVTPAPAPAELGVLMVDGCLLRFRGKHWGHAKSSKKHVEWHEMKLGVYFRSEAGATPSQKRRLLADKRVVSTQGTASELGRRLHWEAQTLGLATARRRRCVSDGAAWIWKLAATRWAGAEEVLDFYHASQHLHALAEAIHGPDSEPGRRQARRWRHRLRHGSSQKLLAELGQLQLPRGKRGKEARRELAYFASHRARMDYRESVRSGPIGSGAVESACRGLQCRFKRTGQFWTRRGLAHLCALREARTNHHWDELWNRSSLPRC